MLRILRKKGVAKIILWVIAIVIIISFGFFGTQVSAPGRPTHAGKIFNKKVSLEDFDKYYKHTLVQAMLHYGENFNNVRSLLNLEAETWDRLILLKETDRRKIKATDKEVIDSIASYPFFQRDGQFDNDLYLDILKFVLRIDPINFEESMRDTLRLSKLYETETAHVTISEEEILDTFKKEHERVQVSYAYIAPEQFVKEIPFDEAQAQKYYEENKIEFLKPPSVKVDYIQLPFATENRDTERDALKAQAEAIHQALSTNPSLSEAAAANNAEVRSSNFFSIEEPDLSLGWSYELLDKIFNLKIGETTQPMETSTGFFIVQVKERKDSYVPEYSEVKEKIRDILALSKTKEIAQEKAKAFKTSLEEELNRSQVKDFAKAAKTLGLEINQTPVFKRGDYLPKVGISKDFEEAAFSLTTDKPLSDVIVGANGYYILFLDNYVAPDPNEFTQQKEVLARKTMMEKKNQAFSEYLTRLRAKAKLEDNITTLKLKAEEEEK